MIHFTDKYTNDKDQKLLLRKINDLITLSRKQYSVMYSPFLDPTQQTLLLSVEEFRGLLRMEGGYEDAERRICRIQTDEYQTETPLPISLFTVSASMKEAVISHRDVLGSLMGLGIRREMIGDILPNGNCPQFFCMEEIAAYIEMNLTKIGRYSVSLSRTETAALYEPKYEPKTVNVSAMRLDCICAEAFGLSRTKAADAIRKGVVSVNWVLCTDTSHEVKSGDKISFRGKGKVEVGDVSGVSKKGRLFVELRKKV